MTRTRLQRGIRNINYSSLQRLKKQIIRVSVTLDCVMSFVFVIELTARTVSRQLIYKKKKPFYKPIYKSKIGKSNKSREW